jgi:hypothetical protein
VRLRAVLIEDNDLAVFYVTHILRADDIESAGFRSKYGAAIELADYQRANTERVASAHQFFVGETDERVCALKLPQAFDEAVDKAVAPSARNKVKNDLGVGCRLHHGAFVDKVAPQFDSVGEIAVVAYGKAAALEFCKQGLNITQDGFAGRRIAHVPHRRRARQAIDHFPSRKSITD